MRSADEGRRTLKAKDVAKLLSVSKATVNDWAARGLIGHYQVTEKLRLFGLDDVERFLHERGNYVPAQQPRPVQQAGPGARSRPRPGLLLVGAEAREPWRGVVFGRGAEQPRLPRRRKQSGGGCEPR